MGILSSLEDRGLLRIRESAHHSGAPMNREKLRAVSSFWQISEEQGLKAHLDGLIARANGVPCDCDQCSPDKIRTAEIQRISTEYRLRRSQELVVYGTTDTAAVLAQVAQEINDGVALRGTPYEHPKAHCSATYRVIDTKSGQQVGSPFKSATRARTRRDKLDLAHGAIRYRVERVDPQNSLTPTGQPEKVKPQQLRPR